MTNETMVQLLWSQWLVLRLFLPLVFRKGLKALMLHFEIYLREKDLDLNPRPKKASRLPVRRLTLSEANNDHLLHLLMVQLYQVELPLSMGWKPDEGRYRLMQMRQMVNQDLIQAYQIDGNEGRPLAIALLSPTDNAEIIRLHGIFTSPMRRREGLASHLLDIARDGRDVHTYASRDSLAWHKAYGFNRVGPETISDSIEMFTGEGEPVCRLPFAIPQPSPAEYDAIDAPCDPTAPHGPANDS